MHEGDSSSCPLPRGIGCLRRWGIGAPLQEKNPAGVQSSVTGPAGLGVAGSWAPVAPVAPHVMLPMKHEAPLSSVPPSWLPAANVYAYPIYQYLVRHSTYKTSPDVLFSLSSAFTSPYLDQVEKAEEVPGTTQSWTVSIE